MINEARVLALQSTGVVAPTFGPNILTHDTPDKCKHKHERKDRCKDKRKARQVQV